jgi:hypothetical protein
MRRANNCVGMAAHTMRTMPGVIEFAFDTLSISNHQLLYSFSTGPSTGALGSERHLSADGKAQREAHSVPVANPLAAPCRAP